MDRPGQPTFDLQQLKVLQATAETGSIAAAARILQLSPSTVSHHLGRLEESAGVELLIRGSRGIVMTEAGSALLRHGGVVFARLAAAERELADRQASRNSHLSVHGFPTAFIDLIPRAAKRLLDGGDDLRLDMAVASREASLAAVSVGEADLAVAFSTGGGDPLPFGLQRVELLEDPMLVVLSRDHVLAARQTLRLADLAPFRWVLGSTKGAEALTFRALRSAGVTPDVILRTGDIASVHGLVASGMGVALSPALALRRLRGDVTTRALEEPISRTVEVVTRVSDRREATARMVEALREVAAGLS